MHTDAPASEATAEALLRAGVRLLADASATPRLDAEVLLGHAMGVTRTALFTRRSEPVAPAQAEHFRSLIAARREGRPVAHLVGEKEFWSLPLKITAEVLTPRPETELLVERALLRMPAEAPERVLDLGTGSGAIALAIASERPRCEVTATDLSANALALAEANAQALGLGNIRFAAGDWFGAVPGRVFDLIVTNPPYVADGEWPATDRELQFEPRMALAGGADGLDAIRSIIRNARAHLGPGGWLLLEHGMAQGEAVRALLAGAGFGSIATHADLARLPRATEGANRS